jgi:hypothetical protein
MRMTSDALSALLRFSIYGTHLAMAGNPRDGALRCLLARPMWRPAASGQKPPLADLKLQLPLYSQKQTQLGGRDRSETCQNRTSARRSLHFSGIRSDGQAVSIFPELGKRLSLRFVS